MDRLGGRSGLELRHPFFDIRLIEFVAGIEEAVHTDGASSRQLQRWALRGVYPDSVAARSSKAEFSPAVQMATAAHCDDQYRLPVTTALGLLVAGELERAFSANAAVERRGSGDYAATHSVGNGLMIERFLEWRQLGGELAAAGGEPVRFGGTMTTWRKNDA
jgi:hypothetical protein